MTKHGLRRSVLALAISTLAWSGMLYPLHASFIGVSPTGVQLTVEPGQVVSGSMTVFSTEKTSVAVSAGDWVFDDRGGYRYVPMGAVDRSLCGWIEVSPLRAVLEPGKVQIIRYHLKVPDDITGAYWGMLFVQQVPEAPEIGGDVNMMTLPRVGVPFFAETQRGSVLDGRVTDVRMEPSPGGQKAALTFENLGNAIIRLNGSFEIRNHEGAAVAKLDFPGENLMVLPGSDRIVEAELQQTLPAGQYVLVALVDYGGRNVAAGQKTFKVP